MSQGGQWTLTGHIPATSHHSTLSSYTAAPNPVDCRFLSLEGKEIPKGAYVICEQTLTCVHTYDQHTKFLNNNTIWTSRSALLTRLWTSSDCGLLVCGGGRDVSFPPEHRNKSTRWSDGRLLFILNYSAGKFIGYN